MAKNVKQHSDDNNTENQTFEQENSAQAITEAIMDSSATAEVYAQPSPIDQVVPSPVEPTTTLIDPMEATLALFPQLGIDTLKLVLDTYEGFMKERRAQEKALPRFSLLEECIRIMKEQYLTADTLKRAIGWSTAELTDLLRKDATASQLPAFNGTGLTKDGEEKAKTPSASLYSCLLREKDKKEPRVKKVNEQYVKGNWTLTDAVIDTL